MDNEVMELIDQLYTMVSEAWGVPLGNEKCIVERDQVLDRLEELKKTYGSFFGGPPLTFTLMREKNRHRAIGRACVFLNNGTAFDAWGNVKKPCVIGPRADCDKCGCIVPFSVKAWKHPSNLLREVWRDLRTVISDQ